MQTYLYIIVTIIGYLLGSLSVSILFSKYVLHEDVREKGSGNAGATNVARVYGLKAGFLTLGGDMLKTTAAALIGYFLAERVGLVFACAGCLLGHCWPIFFGFRGGKGVSTSGCIALLLDWRMFLILILIFLVAVVLSKRVSVGSILAALSFPIIYWILHPMVCPEFFLCLLVSVLVTYLHRQNIVRLIHGKEPIFRPKKK